MKMLITFTEIVELNTNLANRYYGQVSKSKYHIWKLLDFNIWFEFQEDLYKPKFQDDVFYYNFIDISKPMILLINKHKSQEDQIQSRILWEDKHVW